MMGGIVPQGMVTGDPYGGVSADGMVPPAPPSENGQT